LNRSLREQGILVDVQRLRSVETASSVRVRERKTQITDGPFAVTKEFLAGGGACRGWPSRGSTASKAPTGP
jgi:hypothetical protein